MKRLPMALGIVAVGSVILAGCSAPADGADGDATVTITYTNFISNDGNEDNLRKIVDAFEDANPGITVEVTTMPYADYFTALQTDAAAGTLSDVFDIRFDDYALYQANGVLAPITPANPGAIKQSLLEAYSTDGVSYALPTSFSAVVLYYNKDLFDAAGLDYPSSDWTWADEKEAALALTDQAAGVWGDHQPVSFYEYYKVLAQNGGQFLSDDGTSVAFNTPAGVEAAKWLVEKSGTVMPTIEQGQGSPDFDTDLFKAGQLAMLHTGIWVFGAVADVPFGWDIAVEPGNARQASAVFSNAAAVSSASKHPEEAAKFVEFMSSSDVMVDVRLAAGWELPPIADDAKLASYLDMGAPENRQAVFDSLDGIALLPIVAEGQAEMQDIMTEELVEAQAGRKTVEEALASAEQRINAVIGG